MNLNLNGTDYLVQNTISSRIDGDSTYALVDSDLNKYHLKVFCNEEEQSIKQKYEWLKALYAKGFPMAKPLEVGRCDLGNYLLSSWIEGVTVKKYLSSETDAFSYKIGRSAGDALKKLHSSDIVSRKSVSWENRYVRKADQTVSRYMDRPVRFDGDVKLLDTLSNMKYLLKERPLTTLHLDFADHNMMLDVNGVLSVVDIFSRSDAYGDPYIDLYHIQFGYKHPNYYTGLVNAYFDDKPPSSFFSIMHFYCSYDLLMSINKKVDLGKWGNIRIAVDHAKRYLSHISAESPLPTWWVNRLE